VKRVTYVVGLVLCVCFALFLTVMGVGSGSLGALTGCVAVGAVPLSLLFRIKAAQDAKRGGPSL
jgi:hypothetical protein